MCASRWDPNVACGAHNPTTILAGSTDWGTIEVFQPQKSHNPTTILVIVAGMSQSYHNPSACVSKWEISGRPLQGFKLPAHNPSDFAWLGLSILVLINIPVRVAEKGKSNEEKQE